MLVLTKIPSVTYTQTNNAEKDRGP